jgi:hypothetical protein
MALVLKDRVKETTTTTGTGTLTLLGASTGYQSFSAIGNGNTCYYAISSTGVVEWEVGIGTYSSSGTTLSRDTILESSTGGGAIDLSAGTKDVYVVYPAEKGVWLDASGNLVQNQFTSINVTGTATINVATLTSGTISTAPSASTDIVNKTYVDSIVATGVHYHTPVIVESPTALSPVTYNNGTAGVGATLTNAGTQIALVIDGVSVSVNDRVLIYTQADATQNGIYTVTDIGSGSTNWVLTRATDADSYGISGSDVLGEGSAVYVQQGTTGAGETYVCNTPGTITFGTTNITFVQISSAQIYSAGTGLNLSGTTFSVATTGVSAATYGTASQVPQIAINAQGQVTSASNVAIAITASNVSGLAPSATTDTTNASNITSGTLANARTTAAATNGASTIVARDASGNFAAAGITATTFTGDGSLLTSLNGTAITTGTVANARTTASSSNGASTIVARDASGNFTAATITATTFSGAVSGSGANITNLNASAISTGTIANARTTGTTSNGASTLVLRDASGNFAGNTITGVLFSGSGASLTSLNGTAISSGTVANARTTATNVNGASTIVARDASGNFAAGTITASLSGTATSATNATNVALTASSTASAFKVPFANTTASTTGNYGLLQDSTATFTYNPSTNTLVAGTFSGALSGNATTATTLQTARTIATSGGATGTATSFNGSANITIPITALNASTITAGTVPTARLASGTANNTTFLRGDSTWAAVTGGQYYGTAATKAIAYNANSISENVTVLANTNGLSAGPITINTGYNVTVETNAVWVIV